MLRKILIGSGILTLLTLIVLFATHYKSDLSREDLSEYINENSEFIKLSNGADVHFRDEGNPKGSVLLMFHGGLGSLHNWEGWIPYLKDDFRLISLDFPAHGLTGRIPTDIYTRATLLEAARLLMEHLDIDRFAVAGNSMGGGVAIQYALDYPEKVQALVLISSEGIPNSDEGYDASHFSDEKPLVPSDPGYTKLSWQEVLMTKFYTNNAIKSVLDGIVGDKTLLTDEFVNRYGRIIRHQGNRAANVLMFRQWLDPKADPRDLENQLSEITIPVLYMHGSEDTTVPEKIAKRFDELLPNSELIIYEGVGHMAMIEKPEKTAQDVKDFLRKNNLDKKSVEKK